MRKLILILFVLFWKINYAQYFNGPISGYFGGVSSVRYNPAIADNPFKLDISILHVGVDMANNYVGLSNQAIFHPSKFTEPDFQKNLLIEKLNGKPKNLNLAFQFQVPLSFMVAFGKKNNNALAITSHMNFGFGINGLDEPLARVAYAAGDNALVNSLVGKTFTQKNLNFNTMAWFDAGLTYSRVVWQNKHHFVKAGITGKFILGVFAENMSLTNATYKFTDADHMDVSGANMKLNIDANATGMLSNFGFGGSGKTNFPMSGAADIGVVYEWRPNIDKYSYEMDCKQSIRKDMPKHLLSFGFSITDMGALKFKRDSLSSDYTINGQNIPVGSFTKLFTGQADSTIGSFQKNPIKEDKFKMNLPLGIHLFVDYNAWKGVGVNLATSIYPKQTQGVQYTSLVRLTPKYDHKWFGFYLPMTVDFQSNFSMGLGMRLGPLTIGVTNFIGLFNNTKSEGIYFALKASVPQKFRPKDRDKDKISNQFDKCPKKPGPCATQGCPDTDDDGLADTEDDCPEKAGPKALNGCPDRDNDGTKDEDDKCPDVYGLKEMNGCPDQDGDGVVDPKDDCPKEAGLKELFGCPDKDKDGVADKDDLCPDVFGDKDHKGCPDSDADGLYDHQDDCPKETGPLENKGCPYTDTDKDGILDKEDRCVNEAGSKENQGCPWGDIDKDGITDNEDSCKDVAGVRAYKGCPPPAPVLTAKEQEIINYAFDNLEFETGKDLIKKLSFGSLTQLAMLLQSKPNYLLQLDGYTDNVGNAISNLDLSRKRADSVKKFLILKGADPSQITTNGYGDQKPIADNST
ncbi:MAG: DUF5723 family protein, partial [Chitinophagales bacterium]